MRQALVFQENEENQKKTRKQSKVEKREVLRIYQKIEEVAEKMKIGRKLKKRGNPMDSAINSGRRLCPVFSLSGSRGAAPAYRVMRSVTHSRLTFFAKRGASYVSVFPHLGLGATESSSGSLES